MSDAAVTPGSADVRLLDVWGFPDALLAPLAAAGVRTAAEVLARAEAERERSRSDRPDGSARSLAASGAIAVREAVFWRADHPTCLRAFCAAVGALNKARGLGRKGRGR